LQVETESENTSDGPSGALNKCDRNGIVTDSVVGWRKVDSWVPAVWFSGALPPLDWHSGAVSLTCQVMLSSRACGRYTEFACLFVRSTADSLVCRSAIECHSVAMAMQCHAHSCGRPPV